MSTFNGKPHRTRIVKSISMWPDGTQTIDEIGKNDIEGIMVEDDRITLYIPPKPGVHDQPMRMVLKPVAYSLLIHEEDLEDDGRQHRSSLDSGRGGGSSTDEFGAPGLGRHEEARDEFPGIEPGQFGLFGGEQQPANDLEGVAANGGAANGTGVPVCNLAGESGTGQENI